jgi:hypothetical protein
MQESSKKSVLRVVSRRCPPWFCFAQARQGAEFLSLPPFQVAQSDTLEEAENAFVAPSTCRRFLSSLCLLLLFPFNAQRG